MASLGNQHCANCIDILSFPIALKAVLSVYISFLCSGYAS